MITVTRLVSDPIDANIKKPDTMVLNPHHIVAIYRIQRSSTEPPLKTRIQMLGGFPEILVLETVDDIRTKIDTSAPQYR